MTNITLFSQIIFKLDRFSFNKLVTACQTDKRQKSYIGLTYLVAMLFVVASVPPTGRQK